MNTQLFAYNLQGHIKLHPIKARSRVFFVSGFVNFRCLSSGLDQKSVRPCTMWERPVIISWYVRTAVKQTASGWLSAKNDAHYLLCPYTSVSAERCRLTYILHEKRMTQTSPTGVTRPIDSGFKQTSLKFYVFDYNVPWMKNVLLRNET